MSPGWLCGRRRRAYVLAMKFRSRGCRIGAKAYGSGSFSFAKVWQYEGFLQLCATSTEEVSPPLSIDLMWCVSRNLTNLKLDCLYYRVGTRTCFTHARICVTSRPTSSSRSTTSPGPRTVRGQRGTQTSNTYGKCASGVLTAHSRKS